MYSPDKCEVPEHSNRVRVSIEWYQRRFQTILRKLKFVMMQLYDPNTMYSLTAQNEKVVQCS